jgi:hypothetical protein
MEKIDLNPPTESLTNKILSTPITTEVSPEVSREVSPLMVAPINADIVDDDEILDAPGEDDEYEDEDEVLDGPEEELRCNNYDTITGTITDPLTKEEITEIDTSKLIELSDGNCYNESNIAYNLLEQLAKGKKFDELLLANEVKATVEDIKKLKLYQQINLLKALQYNIEKESGKTQPKKQSNTLTRRGYLINLLLTFLLVLVSSNIISQQTYDYALGNPRLFNKLLNELSIEDQKQLQAVSNNLSTDPILEEPTTIFISSDLIEKITGIISEVPKTSTEDTKSILTPELVLNPERGIEESKEATESGIGESKEATILKTGIEESGIGESKEATESGIEESKEAKILKTVIEEGEDSEAEKDAQNFEIEKEEEVDATFSIYRFIQLFGLISGGAYLYLSSSYITKWLQILLIVLCMSLVIFSVFNKQKQKNENRLFVTLEELGKNNQKGTWNLFDIIYIVFLFVLLVLTALMPYESLKTIQGFISFFYFSLLIISIVSNFFGNTNAYITTYVSAILLLCSWIPILMYMAPIVLLLYIYNPIIAYTVGGLILFISIIIKLKMSSLFSSFILPVPTLV